MKINVEKYRVKEKFSFGVQKWSKSFPSKVTFDTETSDHRQRVNAKVV